MGKEDHQPASMAAHHLINQLSAIISHCDLLIENTENGTELSRRLHAIRDIASEAIAELREYQHKRQTQSDGWKAKKTRRLYEKPTVTKLTPEEAKAKLLDAANKGDQGAKDLLELMSHEEKANDKKKSA